MQKSRRAATTDENILLRKAFAASIYQLARCLVSKLPNCKRNTHRMLFCLHFMQTTSLRDEKKISQNIADIVLYMYQRTIKLNTNYSLRNTMWIAQRREKEKESAAWLFLRVLCNYNAFCFHVAGINAPCGWLMNNNIHFMAVSKVLSETALSGSHLWWEKNEIFL